MALKYKLIVNPTAGRGRTRAALSKTIELFAKSGVAYDLEFTIGPNEAGKIARAAREEFDAVVAIGGDGTVNEVAQGMVFSRTPLAVIPGGSGNDFARALGIPAGVEDAVKVILNNRTKTIDAGRINNTYFANSVGIGFDATVTRESRSIKRLKGIPLYLTALMKALGKYAPLPMKISINNAVIEQKVFLLAIGNGTTCGGGFRLTPDALLDDGLFDVTVVDPLGTLMLFRHLPMVFNGTIGKSQYAAMMRTRKLTIESEHPLPVHLDGEVYTAQTNHIEIEALPRALTVIGNF